MATCPSQNSRHLDAFDRQKQHGANPAAGRRSNPSAVKLSTVTAWVTPNPFGWQRAIRSGSLPGRMRLGSSMARSRPSTRSRGRNQTQFAAQIGNRKVSFKVSDIADEAGRARLTHAYASTIYGAQGLTVDQAFVLISPIMNRHDLLVASYRGRDRTEHFIDNREVDAQIRAGLPLSDRRSAQVRGRNALELAGNPSVPRAGQNLHARSDAGVGREIARAYPRAVTGARPVTDRRHHRARSRLKTGLPPSQNEAFATMPMRSATRPGRGGSGVTADISVVDAFSDVVTVTASEAAVIEAFLGSLFVHLFADAKASGSTAKAISLLQRGNAAPAPRPRPRIVTPCVPRAKISQIPSDSRPPFQAPAPLKQRPGSQQGRWTPHRR